MSYEKSICEAISERLVLEFLYDGHQRIVEPYVLGNHIKTNNLVLRGFSVGFSKSNREPKWRLYDMSKVNGLNITSVSHSGNRPLYNPDDKAMSIILCRL